jgi:hypothetical protein
MARDNVNNFALKLRLENGIYMKLRLVCSTADEKRPRGRRNFAELSKNTKNSIAAYEQQRLEKVLID